MPYIEYVVEQIMTKLYKAEVALSEDRTIAGITSAGNG